MKITLIGGEPNRVPLTELWINSLIKAKLLIEPMEGMAACCKDDYSASIKLFNNKLMVYFSKYRCGDFI